MKKVLVSIIAFVLSIPLAACESNHAEKAIQILMTQSKSFKILHLMKINSQNKRLANPIQKIITNWSMFR